ncbi:MAG: CHAT domain-containing protein [Bacteroidetes bacterium]|nr:MAG: CHAT domain-containing protein [Bacteroidota bacterium]
MLKQAGANAWFHKGDLRRAQAWYAEALAGMRAHPEFGMEMWKVYKDLGDVFRRKGDNRRAEEMYEAAIQSAYDYYKPFKNRELAKLNCQLGTYALESGDLDRALAFFQEAMIQVFPEFNNADPAANPAPAEVYTESWIMDACAGKGRTLHARYLRTGGEADLTNAARCFDLAIEGVRQLKQSLGNDAAKIYLGDFSHAFFEEAIAVNFLLWEKRKDPVFIEKIFELMEGSKSSTLQNALQLNRAVIFAGVDKDLLRREEFLRVSMAEYQKRVQEERMKGETKDTSQILVYRKKIGDLEREYDQLLQKIGEEDPRFKSAMREVAPVALSDFRHQILGKTDRVLEFFMGKNNLYILSFDRQHADVRALPLASGVYNELFEWLARFQKPEAMNADYADFLQTGHLLFKQLFGDLAFPSDRPLKLLVIPDGIAAILPFEALNLTPPGAPPVFLIERAELRMAYSASVLTQQENWPVKTKEWVHFAPEFRTGVRGLSPLLYSARETEGVYGMTTFSGRSATLPAFLEWAPRCAWIHLSTHARSGGNGVAPHVEFYDSTLYLPGIYALRLSAEMVILSTCESGLGTIEKGEGVMSLARGFSYAGAKSLISSLWEVNEFSTAGIFSGFYQYLKKGKTRAEALRLAKLDYLHSPDRPAFEKTPWYWAGFMLIGVDGPVRHQSPVRAGFYGLCLVLAGVAWVIWRRRRSAGHSSLRRA